MEALIYRRRAAFHQRVARDLQKAGHPAKDGNKAGDELLQEEGADRAAT